MSASPARTVGRLAFRSGILLLAVVVVVAGVELAVRASDGAYDGSYPLVGVFNSAGQGLHPGSSVDFRGVQVGQVGQIELSGRRVRIVLRIDHGFRVPTATTATIEPENLFGAEDVAFTSPHRTGPWMPAGATIARTDVSSQLDDLFAAADPLLSTIDTSALSSSISELDQATVGQAPAIRSSIQESGKLAILLSWTIGAQLTALDSLTSLSAVLAPEGPTLNSLAAKTNAGLPAINRSQAAYQRLLESLTPLSENLAQFLSQYRPDIGTLLDTGANVTRVLLANQQNIESFIKGAYEYVSDIAHVPSAQTLPDGSHFAYFQIFVDFSDVNALVCNLIAPAAPDMAFLEPLQQALDYSGSPFNCSSEETRFDALDKGSSPSTPPATTTAAPAVPATTTAAPAVPATTAPAASAASAPSAISRAAENAAGSLYQSIGQPEAQSGQSLQGLVTMLLGGS